MKGAGRVAHNFPNENKAGSDNRIEVCSRDFGTGADGEGQNHEVGQHDLDCLEDSVSPRISHGHCNCRN